MKLKLPTQATVTGKTVLLRVDYNVPLEEKAGKWQVEDTFRIERSLKTVRFLLKNKAKVLLLTHLGRPSGKFQSRFSTAPIQPVLEKLLEQPALFCPQYKLDEIEKFVAAAPPASLILLENVRFFPGEEKNSKQLAKGLAKMAEVFVNEAFATAHRKHASVVGIPRYLPSYAGLDFNHEVQTLFNLITKPKRPFTAIIGGAKISDKVGAIENLVEVADIVLVGGGAANNFLKAEGYAIGDSYLEEKKPMAGQGKDFVHFVQDLIEDTKQERILKDDYIPLPKIVYPTDVVAANSMQSKKSQVVELYGDNGNNGKGKQNDDLMYLDIGPKTIRLFKEIILKSGSIFWNGPMGVFEQDEFAEGTLEIGRAVAKSSAYTVIGGGDTIAATRQFGLEERFDYVSAAGGAALTFLAGKILPGMKPLMNR